MMDHLLPTRLDQNLETIQKEVQPWKLPGKDNRCKHAIQFDEWVTENLSESALGIKISSKTILYAKAKLSDRYRLFFRQVPSRCRYRISQRGHKCIYHIWDEAYARLEEMEGRLPETPSIQELQQIQLLKEHEMNTPFATLVALQQEE